MKKWKGNLLTIKGRLDSPNVTTQRSHSSCHHDETVPEATEDALAPNLSISDKSGNKEESEKSSNKICESVVNHKEAPKRVRELPTASCVGKR
jgi:hypothetical protein